MEENRNRRKINLYHLVWGGYALDANEPIFPKVPLNTIKGEDSTIKRICTAPSLDECLTGLGPTFVGLSFLNELKIHNKSELDLSKVTLPFTLVKFCVDRKDPDVWMPGKVIDYVPDAWMTQECWLTKPTIPDEIERVWLVNGKVQKESLLYEGQKYAYYTIVESEWIKEEQKADGKFLEDIIKVTKEWLKQDLGMSKDSAKEDKKQESIVPGTEFSIVSAIAEYTGGGIYIYHGKLSDGNYFRTCDEWESIEITDSDTSVEDADYLEFYDEHSVETVTGEKYETFWNTMLNKIITETPKGNYDVGELESRIIESYRNIGAPGIDELISGGKASVQKNFYKERIHQSRGIE